MTPIQRVKEAIEEIKKGNMVIMLDDENRENEGDLVYAATFSDDKKVNFMASYAKGLICVAVTTQTANRLQLYPMVSSNTSSYETAFTVSVDCANAHTGISAKERDDTIKILANPLSSPKDLVKPGHIFPLIAKDGGVLVRTGHTEGSVDLCKLAGLNGEAVICEIMKDDGTMARMDDLELFSQKHDLSIVYISDIVEYRLANEKLIQRVSTQKCDFRGATTEKITYIDHLSRTHTVIKFNKAKETTNVKFHNIGLDIDLILDDKRFSAFNNSVEYIKENGGVIVFLDTKIISKEQAKEFGVGAQILKDLGIKNINLITKNRETEFVGLAGFGLDVIEKVEII
jgi:3,4-dihydroxy 2-butanone 4-phosphate synthase/GTP cyclohydrolase II